MCSVCRCMNVNMVSIDVCMYVGVRGYMEVSGSIMFTHVYISDCVYETYICVSGSQPGTILPPEGTCGNIWIYVLVITTVREVCL